MKRIINHIRQWNKWRKGCLNGKLHKFLVLIGFIYSPTFELTFLDSEWEAFDKGFKEGLEGKNDRSEHN